MRAATSAPTLVIVDVLSFSTALDVACSRGAVVYPFERHDDRAREFARSVGADVAARRGGEDAGAPTLSPPSLRRLTPGSRLVLPSPNGSTLSVMSRARCTVAGCLRNGRAVARHVDGEGGDVTVVAAGERWPDGSLRVALEDLVGAGAVCRHLDGERTEEALAAEAVFAAASGRLGQALLGTVSGRELCERGFEHDVAFAADLDCSATVPVLRHGAYTAARRGRRRGGQEAFRA